MNMWMETLVLFTGYFLYTCSLGMQPHSKNPIRPPTVHIKINPSLRPCKPVDNSKLSSFTCSNIPCRRPNNKNVVNFKLVQANLYVECDLSLLEHSPASQLYGNSTLQCHERKRCVLTVMCSSNPTLIECQLFLPRSPKTTTEASSSHTGYTSNKPESYSTPTRAEQTVTDDDKGYFLGDPSRNTGASVGLAFTGGVFLGAVAVTAIVVLWWKCRRGDEQMCHGQKPTAPCACTTDAAASIKTRITRESENRVSMAEFKSDESGMNTSFCKPCQESAFSEENTYVAITDVQLDRDETLHSLNPTFFTQIQGECTYGNFQHTGEPASQKSWNSENTFDKFGRHVEAAIHVSNIYDRINGEPPSTRFVTGNDHETQDTYNRLGDHSKPLISISNTNDRIDDNITVPNSSSCDLPEKGDEVPNINNKIGNHQESTSLISREIVEDAPTYFVLEEHDSENS